ncbi:MAG TPA: 2-amino-4-hydroxy-6-hydroxymethyldihydropteridine diphosphokinase [Bacteroidia bacterium]|jgi:2-amino-4-hydroxy-6-hydroxymethyldihydropteridine diphosphokinase|nr:2-amino-4-hydroxy-6-hydroxymethyldihydropteridine diphosphokinase [Bacteroidia bacterium]
MIKNYYFITFYALKLFFLSLAWMNTAYILLGSNEGDRLHHLSGALELIQQNNIGVIVKQSAVYVTVAWGYHEQPDFYNQVIYVETSLTPQQLLIKLLDTEKELGRIRSGTKWMQRIIDLDILFYNDEIIQVEGLLIPHPFIQDRKFVLVPLCEIAETYIHPLLKKDIRALCDECADVLEVKKLSILSQ